MPDNLYMVSVLIPFYNAERDLERCALSLFEQDYPDIQFVFVDDGSQDQSISCLKQVLEKFPDRQSEVRIISHEENKGIAASRNTALKNAVGEFVCFVDSDDWLEHDSIDLLVGKQRENDFDLVSGNRLIHFSDREVLFEEKAYHSKREMVLQMMQYSWDHFITGRLIRRSLFVDNNLIWTEGQNLGEDRYMMTLLAYYANSSALIDSVVYHYERRSAGSLTTHCSNTVLLELNNQELRNMQSLEEFFKDKESVYKDACTRCVMEQLVYNRRLALKYSSKEEFDATVKMIDKRSANDMSYIGWRRKGLVGWLTHNYLPMKFCVVIKRMAKDLIRRITSA